MTLAFMPAALVSTYCSTSLPSAVLPNGFFSIMALFSAAGAGEDRTPRKAATAAARARDRYIGTPCCVSGRGRAPRGAAPGGYTGRGPPYSPRASAPLGEAAQHPQADALA